MKRLLVAILIVLLATPCLAGMGHHRNNGRGMGAGVSRRMNNAIQHRREVRGKRMQRVKSSMGRATQRARNMFSVNSNHSRRERR